MTIFPTSNYTLADVLQMLVNGGDSKSRTIATIEKDNGIPLWFLKASGLIRANVL